VFDGSEPTALPLWLSELIDENAFLLLGVCFALLVIQSIRLWFIRTLAARRVAKHRAQGIHGERAAAKLLKRAGYLASGQQASGSYQLRVDGKLTRVNVRADFLVTRGGRRYVAEVKSGAESAKVTGRATRRQLLEYSFAFDVDGILLVDTNEARIREIEFPESMT